MTTCPVCGKPVDERKAPFSEYNGQIYYFACPACQNRFEENPERYIRGDAEVHGGHNRECF